MAKPQVEKVDPVNIDKALASSKLRHRVYRVGIELEGGWSKLPGSTRVIRDGSVRFTDEIVYSCALKAIGEINSAPMEESVFPSWMKAFYPQKVNETCGMHVHMSFKVALTYERLMVPEFQATVIEYTKRWANEEKLPKTHPIWTRLSGKNEYCQHVFHADEQIKAVEKDYDHHRNGHRYTAVAYRHGRYTTIEVRLLPMMDTSDQGVRAIQHIIDVTNAFLATTAKKEDKFNLKVVEDGNPQKEERRVHV